ncbi:hypothetical protein TanjilG_01176 [Lupinus angustifolius]|uniref:Peptidase C1A papain C-terminal domain-containing protein n=2 Tax=Lupinus angustifolius TaxID=3871 RepID=A0A394DDT7_LUPAN|nr:hypothetical protein TanjilG_01176 [Lupinus angustifolius]
MKGLNWVIKNGGVASEADYPFKGQQGKCPDSKVKSSATISSYIKLEKTEAALLNDVAVKPISVGVDATGMIHYKKDSIYAGGNYKDTTNHAVLIVGYDRTKEGVDYWIVKNSWGKDWRNDDYIWIKRNTGLSNGVCGIHTRAYRPMKDKKEFKAQY